MRVIAAPDSFKGSITAADAASALAVGWRSVRPNDQVIELPLADGGEGTLAVLAAALPGSRWHRVQVSGPGDDPVEAPWLEISGNVAVTELATAAGLTQLQELKPMIAHSYGVGELIGHALDAGMRRMVITLGGSACTDGGSGALSALGARFLDANGDRLERGGGALTRLAAIDLTGLRPPPVDGVTCLTDVRATLLGPDGAAAMFGPQKGASQQDVIVLEEGLKRLAGLLGGDPQAPGAGAAGGTGYGLAAAWGAALRPGAQEIAGIAGLPAALENADLVITGEGQYDETSGTGKVTGSVLAAAARAGVRTTLVAGILSVPPPPGVRGVELLALAGDLDRSLSDTSRWLAAAGRLLAVEEVPDGPIPAT